MVDKEEDKLYEVVDKRKIRLGEDGEVSVQAETESPETEPEAAAEQTVAEDETAEPYMSDLPPLDVYSLVKSFIGILGAHAWQWLGLVKNPVTGRMEKDLEQAKVAIDSISSLAEKLEGKVGAAEQEELKGLLSDLRINYVQQSTKES